MANRLSEEQLDSLERYARDDAPGVVAVEADELAELVQIYRLFHATLEVMTNGSPRPENNP